MAVGHKRLWCAELMGPIATIGAAIWADTLLRLHVPFRKRHSAYRHSVATVRYGTNENGTLMGWTIGQIIASQVIIEGNAGAYILIYYPTPGQGNLVGSWSAETFTDPYGNIVPAGLNVTNGIITGTGVSQSTIGSTSITQSLLDSCQVTNASLRQGTSYQQIITFDQDGGIVLAYVTGTTSETWDTAGDYTWTVPEGVTSAYVECTGAGGGGNGDGTPDNEGTGGPGGGGGEYAAEPDYQLTPGSTITLSVGAGGTGGNSGQGGQPGSDTWFDNGGVYANGGNANDGFFLGGSGGTGSTNTIHHNGGNGASSVYGNTGGCGGGASGTASGAGGNGVAASGSTGGRGGTAIGSSGGNGGAGGNNGANGSSGSSPGGGGGGSGYAANSSSTSTVTKTYTATSVGSYYGPDGSSPNGLRTRSQLFQGGETASGGSYNGNQRSVAIFDHSQIASDFNGCNMSWGYVTLTNQHSWYDSGMIAELDYSFDIISAGSSWPNNMDKMGISSIAEGATKNFNLNSAALNAFGAGNINAIGIGANVWTDNPYNLDYYGYFSPTVKLTLSGVKTSEQAENTVAGNGADGVITVTYQTDATLAFALSPVAGSDSAGNSFAAGLTGNVTAFEPSMIPATPETWHAVTLENGWTNAGVLTCQYKMLPFNAVFIVGTLTPGTTTDGTTLFTLPASYCPVHQICFALGTQGLSSTRNNVGFIAVNTDGSCNVYGVSGTGLEFIHFSGIVPLDA